MLAHKTTTTTTTAILRLLGFCLGQTGWASTRRNIHLLTPIVVINQCILCGVDCSWSQLQCRVTGQWTGQSAFMTLSSSLQDSYLLSGTVAGQSTSMQWQLHPPCTWTIIGDIVFSLFSRSEMCKVGHLPEHRTVLVVTTTLLLPLLCYFDVQFLFDRPRLRQLLLVRPNVPQCEYSSDMVEPFLTKCCCCLSVQELKKKWLVYKKSEL